MARTKDSEGDGFVDEELDEHVLSEIQMTTRGLVSVSGCDLTGGTEMPSVNG